jgi:hypothetical protein
VFPPPPLDTPIDANKTLRDIKLQELKDQVKKRRQATNQSLNASAIDAQLIAKALKFNRDSMI